MLKNTTVLTVSADSFLCWIIYNNRNEASNVLVNLNQHNFFEHLVVVQGIVIGIEIDC